MWKNGNFFVPDTSEHYILHPFPDQIHLPKISKSTEKVLFFFEKKNCIFGQISNSSLIFLPSSSPILGLSFKFFYPPIPSLSLSYIGQNFVFETYACPVLSRRRKNLRWGRLNPSPLGIRRVKNVDLALKTCDM